MKTSTEQRKRRTRMERRQIARALLLGLSITAIVIAADAAGWLQSLEWWFYDQRIRLCQFYTTPPTDRLVHIDIDDGALETVGRWPWHRSTVADVVEELGHAGVKAMAFDVVLSEPEEPKLEADGNTTDHDALLADAIKQAGNVLVPASLTFDAPPTEPPVVLEAAAELRTNLEMTLENVNERLHARGQHKVEQDEYVRALRRAMRERVRQETATDNPSQRALLTRLLPNLSQFGSNPPSVHILQQEDLRLRAERALQPFTLPIPPGANLSTMHAYGAIAPVPAFSMAARFGGLVDQSPLADGIVRTVPVLAEINGRLLPQMGVVLACAALDVDPLALRVSRDKVVIPEANGMDLTIPVSSKHTRRGRVGMFMELPWFGTADWETMYGGKKQQHVNIGLLVGAANLRRAIRKNHGTADDSVQALLQSIPSLANQGDEYLARTTDIADFAAREPYIRKILTSEEARAKYDAAERRAPATRTQEERDYLGRFDALRRVLEQTPISISLLQGRVKALNALLKNRVALIGMTASSSTDLVNTPLATQVPGVVAHGVVFNGIMTRQLWRMAPDSVGRLYALLCGVLTTIAVAFLKPWRAALTVLLLLLGFLFINGIVFFDRANYLVAAAAPVMAIAAVWILEIFISFTVEKTERARVTNRFRNRVDPQLVDYVLEHPEQIRLEGQVKELTVVFTDLEGFTAVSEKLREKTVEVLNEYFKRMVPLIRKRRAMIPQYYGGYMNKLLGDGMMFFFGAPFENPNHATDAVDTVLDMVHETERFSQEMVSQGLPPVIMRAGVNTGLMMVGDAGTDTASDYTVIGDAVNTSARLEKANKRFDSRILIGGGTQKHLDGRFLVRPFGALMLAGKSETVNGFEVMARTVEATAAQRRIKAMSEAIVDSFTRGDIVACLALVEEAKMELGRSKFLAVYEQLCRRGTEEGAVSQKFVLT